MFPATWIYISIYLSIYLSIYIHFFSCFNRVSSPVFAFTVFSSCFLFPPSLFPRLIPLSPPPRFINTKTLTFLLLLHPARLSSKKFYFRKRRDLLHHFPFLMPSWVWLSSTPALPPCLRLHLLFLLSKHCFVYIFLQ